MKSQEYSRYNNDFSDLERSGDYDHDVHSSLIQAIRELEINEFTSEADALIKHKRWLDSVRGSSLTSKLEQEKNNINTIKQQFGEEKDLNDTLTEKRKRLYKGRVKEAADEVVNLEREQKELEDERKKIWKFNLLDIIFFPITMPYKLLCTAGNVAQQWWQERQIKDASSELKARKDEYGIVQDGIQEQANQRRKEMNNKIESSLAQSIIPTTPHSPIKSLSQIISQSRLGSSLLSTPPKSTRQSVVVAPRNNSGGSVRIEQ